MFCSNRTVRLYARVAVMSLLAVVGGSQTARAQSPIEDILKAAANALDSWRYREADSLARTALSFGPALTKKQQTLAMQISVAAAYPEDKPAERQTDSAMARIKRLLAFDSKAWDRNLSWDGLDSLHALAVRASRPGKVVLGSRTLGAILFINDVPQGLVSSFRTIELSPDVPIRVAIRAEKCVAWDTVMMVRAADSVTVGRRNLSCVP